MVPSSRGYGTGYRGRRSAGLKGRPRPQSAGYSKNTHVNALLLQARRRSYIGGGSGRGGRGYGSRGRSARSNRSGQGALLRNRYGQYRVQSGALGGAKFGIQGQRQKGSAKLRPSTSGAPYSQGRVRAQSAGRQRSATPGYWGPKGSTKVGQQAYYPGGAHKRPQSAGAKRGPIVATKQFYKPKSHTTGSAAKSLLGSASAKVTKSHTVGKHGAAAATTAPATTLSVASQNTRSNPNAPIIKVSSSENVDSMLDSSTSTAKAAAAAPKTTQPAKAGSASSEKIAQNIDPKGFEEMRDANRKLAERNAKLRDELQELRVQQAKMQQQQAKDSTSAKKGEAQSDATREVYRPNSGADTGSKERRKVYNSSSTRAGSIGRPQSAGPSKKGVGRHSYQHAQGSPRNAVNVKRQEAARQTYSRQPRPQSAGGARSKPSAGGNPLIKTEGKRPENRPGSAARRRSQNSSGNKVVRPGSAPARRPNHAGTIKQMVQDAGIKTGADEESRIRSIVSAETWDGRGRSDMYHFGKVLGTGSFGVVRLVLHKLTNTKIGVKTYDKRKIKDAAQLKRVQQEIRLMARTNHPNIVRLYETLESVHRVHLVMEYASGGNLCSYVKLKKRLDENEARAIFQQLASAIAYLHTLNIVHRDIKLENILIDGKKNIKITDFGFSVYVQQKKLKIFCGTPSYMPPEIVMRREYYGPPVDCWSLGVLLYATLCGCFPFTANSYPNLYKKIARGQWRAAHSMSQSVSDLLRRMLTVDASKRIDMKQVCRHQWTKSGNAYVPMKPSQLSHLVSENPADDLANTKVVDEMKRHGYRQQAIAESVLGRKKNHVSTTFYLLAEKLGPPAIGPRGANGQSAYSYSSSSRSSSSQSAKGKGNARTGGFSRGKSATGDRTAKLLSELQRTG